MAEDTEKVEYRRTKAYIVELSTGGKIQIDEDEVAKVVQGMQSGSVIVVRQGIINPSFVGGITPDKDRIKAWLDECRYGHGQGDQIRARGLLPLGDIFKETPLRKTLESGNKKMLRQG